MVNETRWGLTPKGKLQATPAPSHVNCDTSFHQHLHTEGPACQLHPTLYAPCTIITEALERPPSTRQMRLAWDGIGGSHVHNDGRDGRRCEPKPTKPEDQVRRDLLRNDRPAGRGAHPQS